MTPEERELRRALAARSADPSPDLQSRIADALEHALPVPRAMPAIAFVVAALLTITSVGILIAMRHYIGVSRPQCCPASASRLASPTSPVNLPAALDLSAPNAKTVWALVDDRLLYVSADEGSSWQQRAAPPNLTGNPHSISFLDESNGWALFPGGSGTGCGNGAAKLWHTTDGAKTWQLAAEVDFRSDSLGGNGLQDCKDTVTFVDQSRGYVTTWNDGVRPAVWRTSDGGKTWSRTVVADPPGFATQSGGYELRLDQIRGFGGALLAPAYGMQPGNLAQAYVFQSRDGGATWSVLATLPNRPESVSLVSATRWLFVVPHGSMETTDAGRTWHSFASDYDQAAGVAPAVVFADANVGYATVRGSIQRTDDRGTHWTYVSTPGTAPPASPTPFESLPAAPSLQLSVPSASVVWALAEPRRLYLSTDGGVSWRQRTLPPSAGGGGHVSFSFVDATNGWALFPGVPETQCNAAGAEVWRTMDGAVTWHEIFSVDYKTPATNGMKVAQCKESISFVDTTHGFVTAHDPNSPPTIYRTSDGGVTWAASTLPDPPGFVTQGGGFSLTAGQVRDYGGVLLTTASGRQDGDTGDRLYVFRSTDGGEAWAYAAFIGFLPPSGTQFRDFALVDATRWIAFKGAGGGAVTSDAGTSWIGFVTDFRDAPGSSGVFAFADPRTGFVATGPSLEKTTDGGAHWTVVKIPGT